MAPLRPEVLLLSSKFDYSTDHIAYRLHHSGVPYLRLNRDQFQEMSLTLEAIPARLYGTVGSIEFEISSERLRSVYFRAPVFLRDNYQPAIGADEQFARSQWAAFIRSLTVFCAARWLNHPMAVYQAEVKPYQLRVASSVGFQIPRTIITNDNQRCHNFFDEEAIIAKTLDSVVLRAGDNEAFIYTSLVPKSEFLNGSIAIAPIIAQQPLLPKMDIRVTVVGDQIFPVEITSLNGEKCPVDWRLQKKDLVYRRHQLPIEVAQACVQVTRDLGLSFGGIDLVKTEQGYWFIEINPTGEWSWLMEPTGYQIDEAIGHWLLAE